jgi:hypothetical protein
MKIENIGIQEFLAFGINGIYFWWQRRSKKNRDNASVSQGWLAQW